MFRGDCCEPLGEDGLQGAAFVYLGPAGEMGHAAHEEVFFTRKSIVDRELSGWWHGGIEKSGSNKDGNRDLGSGGGGIKVRQDLHYLRMVGMIFPDRIATSHAGELDSERVIGKAGDVEESGLKAVIPGQSQGSDPSAKALAIVTKVFGRCGAEF